MSKSIECDIDVQVLPEGEETIHSWDGDCNCRPVVSLNKEGKMVYEHRACDEQEILEVAYYTPLHTVRQLEDC
jgi:hypothetical protein